MSNETREHCPSVLLYVSWIDGELLTVGLAWDTRVRAPLPSGVNYAVLAISFQNLGVPLLSLKFVLQLS